MLTFFYNNYKKNILNFRENLLFVALIRLSRQAKMKLLIYLAYRRKSNVVTKLLWLFRFHMANCRPWFFILNASSKCIELNDYILFSPSDFIVNEIDLDGNVVRLTNFDLPFTIQPEKVNNREEFEGEVKKLLKWNLTCYYWRAWKF